MPPFILLGYGACQLSVLPPRYFHFDLFLKLFNGFLKDGVGGELLTMNNYNHINSVLWDNIYV